MVTFDAASEEDTQRLGQALADSFGAGLTIALEGTLGAGKTRLVQAIAAGCQIAPQQVTSPTFVLCQHHHGTRHLHHFDAYRLADVDEFLELGPEEFFDSSGITLIEWADRVTPGLPSDRLVIRIEVTGSTARQFELSAWGPESSAVLDRLQERIAY